jgi:hypothetical protein
MSNQNLSAKEYLSRAFRIDQRINGKLEEVMSLRSLAEKASGVLTATPISKGGIPKGMEDTIVKLIDLEAVISEDLKILVDTKLEITTIIKCVEVTELRTLLEMRHLNFMTWEHISDELHCALRHVFRLHGKALGEVDRVRRA